MLSLGQKGIAGITVAVAAVAIAGGSVGTPMAVDSFADQQPDSPFYGLEKAGETIKETTYAGGQEWEIDRAKERTSEFKNMAEKGKANKYKGLIDQAGNRLNNAAKSGKNANGLKRARNAIGKHMQVLENVQEKVDNQAKAAISLAISRSAQEKAAITSVASDNVVTKAERKEVKKQMREINQETQRLRNRVRENLKQGMKAGQVIQNINIKTGENLTKRVQEIAGENKGPAVEKITEMAQKRLEKAAMDTEDNTGLKRAQNAIRKHIRVLENVREKVPDVAKPAISLAINKSSKQTKVLENTAENGITPGEKIQEKARNQIREQFREIAENHRKEMKNLRKQIRNVQENAKNKIENLVKDKEKENEETEENEKQKGPGIPS